jgi:DNA-binding transcriptional MerR regulator
MRYLRTSDLAQAVGVHANTVRRYEMWGLLPPAERSANGYRLFTHKHLDCLRVACMINKVIYAGKAFRLSALRVIPPAVADDWKESLERAYAHLAFVQSERAQAEAAAVLLERWAAGMASDASAQSMQIGQAAALLNVSVDMLRNWERNGLITIPRNENNRYREYGSRDISRLRVIRALSRAGYSQMAILRMLLQLDRGITTNLRYSLDTPAPDEDVYVASDRWLSTLAAQEETALRLITLIEDIINTRSL